MIDTSLIDRCLNCESIQVTHYKFCGNCGKENPNRNLKRSIKNIEDDKHIRYFLSYSIITIFISTCFALIDDSKLSLLILTSIFAAIDILYAGLQPISFSLFNLKKFNLLTASRIIIAFISTAIIVNYFVNKINFKIYGYVPNSIDYAYEFENPLLSGLLISAVFPAILEELSFRGFIYNNLYFLRGKRAAMLGSSFLFAVVHFSLLSLFWLIPFGLFLAYLREKHNTIIYGMIAHFTHNATIVIIDLYF